MRPVIHLASLLGILGVVLIGVTGCGEKRLNVATLSGSPGEEANLSASGTDDTDLSGTSIDESSLEGQNPSLGESLADAAQEIAPIEPLHFSHQPSIPDQSNDSFLKDPLSQPSTDSHSEQDSESAFMGDAGTLTPLTNGTDVSAQSSSSTMNDSPMNDAPRDYADISPFETQRDFQDDSSSPQGGMEPIPETFQVAKAEPSDIIRQQLDKIQEEELATVSAGLEDVFFQFDSWSLTEEAKESLERDLAWLRNDPTSRLVIEGHADQRGTQAYNMVLAKKRAMAIRDYLTQLGVDPSRLSVISYGKDKPFCQDPTEVCHQLNRRGHLLVKN
jgi:outer membrane protein OmpA-like peptidoglycan-associated protein